MEAARTGDGPGRAARLRLVGVGAMSSPRFRPAGLLVSHDRARVLIDGGPDTLPPGTVGAWLVTDLRSELIAAIRKAARARGLVPSVSQMAIGAVSLTPLPVAHTSHPTYGYLIQRGRARAAWAPEFAAFPDWADGVDVLFADAAGWRRPIRFARGVGGHMAALDVAEEARRRGVRTLVFAHVGRPTIRALDAGEQPPYGEIGREGRVFTL